MYPRPRFLHNNKQQSVCERKRGILLLLWKKHQPSQGVKPLTQWYLTSNTVRRPLRNRSIEKLWLHFLALLIKALSKVVRYKK